MSRLFLSVFFVFALFSQAFSQSHGLGSWNILNVKVNTSGPWSFFAEAQLRSLHFYNDFHYHEFKGGVQFQMTPDMQVALAAGKYDTYKEGGDFVLPKNNDEIRIWPQISLVQKIGRFKFVHRYRAEFRFTNNGFKKRFRSRVGLSYPIKSASVFIPTSAGFSNEIFFTDKEAYFERNRVMISASWNLSESLSATLGYLHQFDYKINDETGRDFLVLGLYYKLGEL